MSEGDTPAKARGQWKILTLHILVKKIYWNSIQDAKACSEVNVYSEHNEKLKGLKGRELCVPIEERMASSFAIRTVNSSGVN